MRINYLDIANQSDEECQAPQRDKYAKCQFQTVTCRLKYVAESAVNTINNNKNKKFIILEKALILWFMLKNKLILILGWLIT